MGYLSLSIMMHFPFSFPSLPSQTRNLFSSLLSFKLSAGAAPLRRSCSTLVLAALSAAVAGAQPADNWTIETVAGGGSLGDGGPAAAAQLRRPTGVALDGAGNLYIADTDNNRIRKVDAAGVITTVAGTGTFGFSGDGGPAVAAQLNRPTGVAADGAGNLYIADHYNNRIRKVDAAGVITTVAQLSSPQGVAVDGDGNLYIATGNRIRKVDAAGVISTVAGDGTEGYSGDGGPATAARLNSPRDVAVDGVGNLYIADSAPLYSFATGNNRIRKVDAAGVISTVAGDGTCCYSGDGGPAVAAGLGSPTGVAVDGDGNLYIADTLNHRIRKVDAAGVITTVAGDGTENRFGGGGFGGDGGPATAAQLRLPRGVAVDGAGNLYIATLFRIRKVDAAGVITTVAAGLREPRGMAPDGAGNLYIADTFNHRILKVDAAGVITTVAQLSRPQGVALDGAGNLYIADTGNNRILKVDAAGVISAVAGNGREGYSGDGGPATAARLGSPRDVAVDGDGNLYIATGNRIRKVDAAGVISTVAGDGFYGYGGDGGPATAARLGFPTGVAVDGDGNLYIADRDNDRIRRLTPPDASLPHISAGGVVLATGTPAVNRISPNAIISVFGWYFAPEGTRALTPELNAAGGVADNLAATCLEIAGERVPLFAVFPHQINAQAPHGLTPGTARLDVVRGCGTPGERRAKESVAVAPVSPAFFNFVSNPDGRNPVVALHGGGPALVGPPGAVAGAALTPAAPGEIVTLFGTGFGPTEPALEAGRIPGVQAPLAGEVSFYFGSLGVLQSSIETVAGNGTPGFSGDGGAATATRLYGPSGVALDGAGNLYIADWSNHRIRKVDAAGVITTVAGDGTHGSGGDGGAATAAQLRGPADVALDGAGNLYIADTSNNRIRKVDAAGVITTVAGDGTCCYGGDGGPAVAARLQRPSGVVLDGAGNLYIADTWNRRIRKVDAAGVITTVAGDGTEGYGGDGGPATEAQLYFPSRVALDGAGNLYFSDQGNERIRKVDAAGVITTVAGNGTRGSGGDGGAATAAQLNSPVGVALDGAGNLYIADWGNNRIRKVDYSGNISTVAGTGARNFGGDGGLPTEAHLNWPTDVAVDGAGNLYIADGGNNRIRRVSAQFSRRAAPLYAGAAPCCAGLYQFAVRLPDDLPDGNVPVTADVQGVSTPPGPFLAIQRR